MSFIKKFLGVITFPCRYGWNKLSKSLISLYNPTFLDEKQYSRNLLRVALIWAGGGLGLFYGTVFGASLGTLLIPVPILGTLIGALLGGFLGMSFGLMTGALVSKMIIKMATGAKHLFLTLIGGYKNKFPPVHYSKQPKYEPHPDFAEWDKPSNSTPTIKNYSKPTATLDKDGLPDKI